MLLFRDQTQPLVPATDWAHKYKQTWHVWDSTSNQTSRSFAHRLSGLVNSWSHKPAKPVSKLTWSWLLVESQTCLVCSYIEIMWDTIFWKLIIASAIQQSHNLNSRRTYSKQLSTNQDVLSFQSPHHVCVCSVFRQQHIDVDKLHFTPQSTIYIRNLSFIHQISNFKHMNMKWQTSANNLDILFVILSRNRMWYTMNLALSLFFRNI